jgi:hypothetical protein
MNYADCCARAAWVHVKADSKTEGEIYSNSKYFIDGGKNGVCAKASSSRESHSAEIRIVVFIVVLLLRDRPCRGGGGLRRLTGA